MTASYTQADTRARRRYELGDCKAACAQRSCGSIGNCSIACPVPYGVIFLNAGADDAPCHPFRV